MNNKKGLWAHWYKETLGTEGEQSISFSASEAWMNALHPPTPVVHSDTWMLFC